MRWLFSAQKTTRRFLISQQYHLHGGFDFGGSPLRKSIAIRSLFCGHQYNTSSINSSSPIAKSTPSLHRLMNPNKHEKQHNDMGNKKVDLEITSTDIVKPASPTSERLRAFNLSIIDQFFFDCYSPLILFLPNNNNATVTEVVNHLKNSLSEILTRFYPFAGEVKDNLHIECNDKGVCFIEARVNQSLEDFLHHPDDEKARELMPKSPRTGESSIGNYIMGVQVNIFNCGGIGISTSVTHKIIDAQTYFTFMKAWAAAASGSLLETISPSFVASDVFPNNPSLKYSAPSKLMAMATESLTTKRFAFDSKALSSLKALPVASRSPTRVEATTALIWKAAAKAASTVRPFGPQSPHVLLSLVNLRKRASPPLPDSAIGNIVDSAAVICFPETKPDLPNLINELRKSIATFTSEHVETLKGEKGHEVFDEMLRKLNRLADVTNEGDCLFATSVMNSGIYDIDFGWGKPIWIYIMNAGFSRIAILNDTVNGDGVEVTVTLSIDEMELFERDPELLSYAIVDPSPLKFLNN